MSRFFVSACTLLLGLLWVFTLQTACGPLGSGQEPLLDSPSLSEGSASEKHVYPEANSQEEVTPEQRQESSPSPESTPSERAIPETREEGASEQSPNTDAGGSEQVMEAPVRENPVDARPPEQSGTTLPKGPTWQASAVSLAASFLGNHLQKGLMERDAKNTARWHLSWVIPKGKHTFDFRLNGKSQQLGNIKLTQWPVAGLLEKVSSGIQIDFPEKSRYTFTVDLQMGQWFLKKEAVPTSVQIEGDWNQKSGQRALLAKKSDGTFSQVLYLEKGTMKWSFSVQLRQWSKLGARYPARGLVPQGGVLFPGASGLEANITYPAYYRIRYWPLERRYSLRQVPKNTAEQAMTLYKNLLTRLQKASTASQKNQLLLDAFRLLSSMRQIPIVQGNKVVFLLWWSRTAPVYVAGSFNGWSKTALKMNRISGTDFYHVETTLTKADAYAYKFVDSSQPTKWMTDPRNPAFAYDSLGPNSIVNLAGSGKSHLERYASFSATLLKNKREVIVYLPPGYRKNAQARYPVLYMHDGQNVFDPKSMWGGWGTKETVDNLLKAKKIQPTIVVGMANTPGRMDEYTHVSDKLQGRTVGGKAKWYADFILREVKPFIDGHYRTLPDKRHTSVMGSSLGGLVSLWLGWQYPDAFFRIGALSSTFGWGTFGATNPTLLQIVEKGTFQNLVIYLDSGSPKDNYKETLQMLDILQKKRQYIPGLNMLHWTEKGAIHNERAWKLRLFRPLEFLLSW